MVLTKVFERCRVCNERLNKSIFQAKNPWKAVTYYECDRCEYVQTERPTWLEEAYKVSINASDTGICKRNKENLSTVIASLALLRVRRERVVDYAGGYGILVRMLRDKGIDAYWADQYTDNLFAKGFEYSGGKAGLVTAFEAFEHFVEPLNEAKKLREVSDNILFSTSLIRRPYPSPADWWYYGLDHGQHIGFFRVKTLRYIGYELGLNVITDNSSLHLFSRRKVSSLNWKMYRRLARMNQSWMVRDLQSKTWSDHMEMCRQVTNRT